MNAKEISDATLESVTPADNDLMILYDVSEGVTGKAPISAIAPKVAENIDISTLPAVTPDADDVLMIGDTSAGTTGKSTIADIFKNIKKVSGEKREINLGSSKSNVYCDWFTLPPVSVPNGAFILKVELGYENINISNDIGRCLGQRYSNPGEFVIMCNFSGIDVTGSIKAWATVYYI